jgi:cytochrome c oxidase subunit 2
MDWKWLVSLIVPEQASSIAGEYDALFFFLVAISLFFGVLIAAVVVTFAIRFRRKSDDERPKAIHGSLPLEIAWTLIPAAIVAVVFLWSAEVFFRMHRVPKDAMQINVVGKRWMWKLQHMSGQREINELHLPVGVPVKLTLTSEDVIHSFFVPAFRIKKDAVPGRYNTIWFTPTKTGRYHLFCAEYCGTKHSAMIGTVIVLEPAQFQAWLAGGPAAGQSLAAAGEKLFQELACVTCHRGDTGARGPSLEGVFGNPVKLQGGSTVVADEAYLRESIMTPTARVVEGYQPIMPTFQGLISEEGLLQLIAYIETLKPPEGKDGAAAAAAAGQGAPKP